MKYYSMNENEISFSERREAGSRLWITQTDIRFSLTFEVIEIKVDNKIKSVETFEKLNPHYIEKTIKYIQNQEKKVTKEFDVYFVNTFSTPFISKHVCVSEAASSFTAKDGTRLMKEGRTEYASRNKEEMVNLFEKVAKEKIAYFQKEIEDLQNKLTQTI